MALADANTRGIVHPPSVRQLLEQRRAEAGRPVALSAEVPQDPRLRDVVIRPHALGLYDQLQPADTKGRRRRAPPPPAPLRQARAARDRRTRIPPLQQPLRRSALRGRHAAIYEGADRDYDRPLMVQFLW